MKLQEMLKCLENFEGYSSAYAWAVTENRPKPPYGKWNPIKLLSVWDISPKRTGANRHRLEFEDFVAYFDRTFEDRVTSFTANGYLHVPELDPQIPHKIGIIDSTPASLLYSTMISAGERLAKQYNIELVQVNPIQRIRNYHLNKNLVNRMGSHAFTDTVNNPSGSTVIDLVSKVIDCKKEFSKSVEDAVAHVEAAKQEAIETQRKAFLSYNLST